jgi:hypothetical protein
VLNLAHGLDADIASAVAIIRDIGSIIGTSKWCDSAAFTITGSIQNFLRNSPHIFACDCHQVVITFHISCNSHAFFAKTGSSHISVAIASAIFATSILWVRRF